MLDCHFKTHFLSSNTSRSLKFQPSLSTGKAHLHNRVLILLKSSPQISWWWTRIGWRANVVWHYYWYIVSMYFLCVARPVALDQKWRIVAVVGTFFQVLAKGPKAGQSAQLSKPNCPIMTVQLHRLIFQSHTPCREAAEMKAAVQHDGLWKTGMWCTIF